MAPAVVMCGGGVLGATAAARCAREHTVTLLHASYGQRAAKAEAEAVRALGTHLGAERVIDLDVNHVQRMQEQTESAHAAVADVKLSGVVGSHVLAPSTLRGLFPVLVTAGLQCALRIGAVRLVVGLSRHVDAAHLGLAGAEQRPDQGREVLHALNFLAESLAAARGGLLVEAPLMDLSHAEVIKLAGHLQVPLEHTWSCERPGPKPCTRCAACKWRLEAFTEAQAVDPLIRSLHAEARA
ncbi:MAG: 7-cyano-7-deazaguanine synthase [Planctomycetes bacterium]|nr:7-cyano-7-deazaguanine synthase [Planctomycetota bacterium]